MRAGRRESIYQEDDPNVLRKLQALGFMKDPATGEVTFAQAAGEPVMGERPRVGVEEGILTWMLSVQEIPTEQHAYLMHHMRQRQYLLSILKELKRKSE